MSDRKSHLVLIGSWDMYRSGTGNGLRVYRFDAETGALALLHSAFPEITVGAVCLDATRNIVFCVDERTTLPGNFLGGGGLVFSIAFGPETGELTEICHRPSCGSLPSGVAVDPTGRHLIVTHHTDRTPITKVVRNASGAYGTALEYDDATTVLFPLDAVGAIGAPCGVHHHTGSGGPLPKQTHPQNHSVTASPCGQLFVVCDKGNDHILAFGIDPDARALKLLGQDFRSIPGSSPRYAAFHPTRPYLFVNHETRAVVSSLSWNLDGRLSEICTADALPQDRPDDPEMKQSDIRVHPSGTHLYGLIRGISAASVFAVDEDNGGIERVQTIPLDGNGPRACAISPDGRFMLIAALTSSEVLVWSIGDDGRLSPTGRNIAVPNPGTVTFLT